MSIAFVFPGQGSQSIGMLADIADQEPLVEDTLDRHPMSWGMIYGVWFKMDQKQS